MQDHPLLKLLSGEQVHKPPFWEVWFAMREFLSRRYGDDEPDSRIAMAEELGMAALSLGSVPTNVMFKVDRPTRDGTQRYSSEGGLHSLSQLEESPLPDWDAVTEKMIRARKRLAEEGIACWIILPWCFHAASISMGLANLALKCYDDIDFVHTYMEWVEDRNRRAIDTVIAEVRPDFVLYDGDCAYKNGLMVSPPMFRELVFEKTQKSLAHLRKLDIPYTFHTDGKLDDVIPLLVELGFCAVHGCEKQANDLDLLVDEFGDDICLVGNMDVVFLARSTPEQVRLETEKMLVTGSRKGRFAAACNTSPLDYIPDENYLAMADVIKNF